MVFLVGGISDIVELGNWSWVACVRVGGGSLLVLEVVALR